MCRRRRRTTPNVLGSPFRRAAIYRADAEDSAYRLEHDRGACVPPSSTGVEREPYVYFVHGYYVESGEQLRQVAVTA